MKKKFIVKDAVWCLHGKERSWYLNLNFARALSFTESKGRIPSHVHGMFLVTI